MAIVNFSVPDDVKMEFDRAFKHQNKSAVIAELMRRAVAEARLRRRRNKIFRELTARRDARPSATADKIRTARQAVRS